MAGQYAKPRSADRETRDGQELPSYRGDLVNGLAFTAESREPDPERLLRGYERAAISLNFIRSLIDGGFADLHHPENWDLDFVGHSGSSEQYHRMVQRIVDGLEFFEAYSGTKLHDATRVEFFTSHEGLHLLYEQAQTRFLEHRQSWYNLTTHTPWIGMRTADPDGAHVEYFRGIENPIGIKIGAELDNQQLQRLLEELNPGKTPGRITLIHRFGAGKIAKQLPPLIDAVARMKTPVLWMSDPMHGNTETVAGGVKTRRLENILSELETAARIHSEKGGYLGGVHLELTGEHVTECTGGARGLSEADLSRAYRTQVDPRLNYEQAMEVAFTIAGRSAGRS
jgi:3-deoxy-7-phosphoheptulonate synthase